MDLSAPAVRSVLHDVECSGWECATAVAFLAELRLCVVLPVVRRSGLRGPSADQAEASGWEAAWDALRRPTARTAQNPGGMVWTAVRRAVWAEVQRDISRAAGRAMAHRESLDHLLDSGWQLASEPTSVPDDGPLIDAVVRQLVAAGWEAAVAADAIAILADQASHREPGTAATRWRLVAVRLGIPQWRASRLATLLLGEGGTPGVIELAAESGLGVLADADVQAAFASTARNWSSGPATWLVARRQMPNCSVGA